MFLLDNVYGPPVVIILTSHDTSCAHTADGPSLSLVRLSGTLYQLSSGVRTLRCFSRNVLYKSMIYIYIYNYHYYYYYYYYHYYYSPCHRAGPVP